MVSLAKVDEDARMGRGPGSLVLAGSGAIRSPARLMGSTATGHTYVIEGTCSAACMLS